MFLPKFSYHKVELLPTDAKLNSLFNLGNKFEKKLNLASRRRDIKQQDMMQGGKGRAVAVCRLLPSTRVFQL